MVLSIVYLADCSITKHILWIFLFFSIFNRRDVVFLLSKPRDAKRVTFQMIGT